MTATNYRVAENTKLEDLTSPIYQNRKLRWSGEGDEPGKPGRIPELGETVLWKNRAVATVDGHFQANGALGVKLILDFTEEIVSAFGCEIVVASEGAPVAWPGPSTTPFSEESDSQDKVSAQRAEVKRILKWVN
jgi:hypothetical protein